VDQEIRFCRTADGARLAYATHGRGPPLVRAATWLTHLEFDWSSPVWRHWLWNRRFGCRPQRIARRPRKGGICEIGLTLRANGVIMRCFQMGTDSLFVHYGSDGTREEGPPG